MAAGAPGGRALSDPLPETIAPCRSAFNSLAWTACGCLRGKRSPDCMHDGTMQTRVARRAHSGHGPRLCAEGPGCRNATHVSALSPPHRSRMYCFQRSCSGRKRLYLQPSQIGSGVTRSWDSRGRRARGLLNPTRCPLGSLGSRSTSSVSSPAPLKAQCPQWQNLVEVTFPRGEGTRLPAPSLPAAHNADSCSSSRHKTLTMVGGQGHARAMPPGLLMAVGGHHASPARCHLIHVHKLRSC